MRLHEVNRGVHKHKKTKRLGRGPGSGQGKTAGRGHKGQYSRSGVSHHPTFQGGMMPLVRRIPKRGFTNQFAVAVAAVNVADLEDAFEAGAEVTPEILSQEGLVKGRFDELKILGDGLLTKKLTVRAHRFSKAAAEKIQSAGGEAVVLPGKVTVAEKKKQRAAQKKAQK